MLNQIHKKIAEVSADIQNVNAKTNEYQRLSDNLKNISNQVSENSKNKNNIPNLLSEIMYAIPKEFKLQLQKIQVENTLLYKHNQKNMNNLDTLKLY